MHPFLLPVIAACALVVNARVMHLPISAQRGRLLSGGGLSPREHETQTPLRGEHGSSRVLPVESFYNLIYTVNITIGTPPQPITVALDTAGSLLFVPSADYNDTHNAKPGNLYNSSLSSSYQPNGTSIRTRWADVDYTGKISIDTVHVDYIPIFEQKFEEYSQAQCMSIGCFENGYDGVLGLAPPWNTDSPLPNVLSTLADQRLLDANLFALHLPSHKHPTAALTIGNYDATLESNLTTFPVVNPRSPSLASHWMLPITSITFNTDRHPLSQSLPGNATAWLNSPYPYLVLPDTLARNITLALGARPGPAWFHNVPCATRAYMPTLTFSLGVHGAGADFTLSPYDYAVQVDLPDPTGTVCLLTVFPSGAFGLPKDIVLLGAPFFRAVYGVFRFDRWAKEILLAQL